ncbi:MAG: ABC transporter permease [Planctomycetaceae bacterium]|nr:hypothetical protein [Planctomycetota bacterium]MCQ3950999.1 hypothetical protein [Planctomycetota bacterium]NUO15185.1 ABC transporter permease [Planctomycetaceae bacterium]
MSTLVETPSLFKRIFMNPIAVRELRVACRGWKLMVILTAYLLVQGAIFAIWISSQYDNLRGTYSSPTSIGAGLFITMSIVLVCVVMLVFPAFSSTAIAAEHERKSFDLLMLTPLSPWEIALGKFIAAGVQASVFLVATIPLFALANIFGGIDPSVFFMTLWILILLSLFIGFIGVYASSLVTRAIPAVLVTYMFAIALGVVLIIVFSTLMFAAANPSVRLMFPIVSMFVDPTVSEGIYYACAFGVTTTVYCAYFFLSTTNRLKPLSHNKSTSMRLYWTAAMIVMPALFGAYFLATRLPSDTYAVGTLLISAVYIGLALLVPAVTFPAEPALASRRVRKEMEKLPQPLLAAGGSIFWPGGARGAAHTSFLAALGLGLMFVVGSICYSQLNKKLDDPVVALARASELARDAGNHSVPAGTVGRPAPAGAPVAGIKTKLGASSEREVVERYHSEESTGYLLLLLALGASVLVVSQVTWRVSLSGLSKSVSGILAALIIGAWLVVPLVLEGVMSRTVNQEQQTIAQFSPIHGAVNGWMWGKSSGYKSITLPGSSEYARHEQRETGFKWRWITFMATAMIVGSGLLISNALSHRRVLKLVAQASSRGQSDSVPVAYTPGGAPSTQPSAGWIAATSPAAGAGQPPSAPTS